MLGKIQAKWFICRLLIMFFTGCMVGLSTQAAVSNVRVDGDTSKYLLAAQVYDVNDLMFTCSALVLVITGLARWLSELSLVEV